MDIKIGNNTDYLILRDIISERPSNGDGSDFYLITLALQVDGIQTNIRASILLGELRQLLLDLNELYNSLKHEFIFSNIEDNVKVKITPTTAGQIILDGYLKNANYSAKVNFKITTDQSYIPESIKQLKDCLETL